MKSFNKYLLEQPNPNPKLVPVLFDSVGILIELDEANQFSLSALQAWHESEGESVIANWLSDQYLANAEFTEGIQSFESFILHVCQQRDALSMQVSSDSEAAAN